MSKAELNGAVAEAIENLRRAMPGAGTAESRAAARAAAGDALRTLPAKWWRKANPDLVTLLCQYGEI